MKIKIILGVFIISVITLNAQVIDTTEFNKWIDENSINLDIKSNFNKLVDIIKDKPVIGLGECVHASKTINNLRFEITKELIKNANYRNVAFEMSFNTGLKVNNYIKTGQGNIRQILKESHFFLNSIEMLEFIEWIRNFNNTSETPVSIYGFDIQSNIDIIEDLLSYYNEIDNDAASLVSYLFEILSKNEIKSFGEYPEIFQDSVFNIINKLEAKHKLNRKNYIHKKGFIEYEYSNKRMVVLTQHLQMLNSGYSQSLKMRDSCNAALVKWIKDFEGEDSKIVLFAHNGHLSSAYKFVPRVRTLSCNGFYEDYPDYLISGYYLKRILGYDNYYFIGTQFSHGFFMGFDPENNFKLSRLEVFPPEPNSFPYLLKQVKQNPYFISFEFPQGTPRFIINYICSLQSFYEIGAAYDFKYAKARLIDNFDAIIYIDEVEESDILQYEKE